MLAASRHRKAKIAEVLGDLPSGSNSGRALVVEANPRDLVDARVALMEAGYARIDVAISLRLAFELVKENRYAVSLIDYILPDGDGLELMEWLDDQSEVIMITGKAGHSRTKVTRVPVSEETLAAVSM